MGLAGGSSVGGVESLEVSVDNEDSEDQRRARDPCLADDVAERSLAKPIDCDAQKASRGANDHGLRPWAEQEKRSPQLGPCSVSL